MSWQAVLVVETMRDDLARRARRLVETTHIDKKEGLSPSQVHHLIVTVNRTRSLRGVERYIEDAIERSQPKDLIQAEWGKGDVWKQACPSKHGTGCQFLGERLREEAREVFVDAREKARKAGAEEVEQQAAAMACLREFFGYLGWYFFACKKEVPQSAVHAQRG